MLYIHLIDRFRLDGGGVGSVILDVSREMSKAHKDVYIIKMWSSNDKIESDINKWAATNNVKYISISPDGKSLVSALLKLRKQISLLSQKDSCCLYLHLKRAMLYGIISSICLKVKRIEVFHSRYSNYWLQATLSKPFMHGYLSVSKEAKQQLVQGYNIPSHKVTVAYNGIDIDSVRNQIKDLARDTEKFRFLSVGRLNYQKDFKTSVAAYKELIKEKLLDKSEYYIAGEGEQKELLENIAEGTVSFMGLIDRSCVYSNISVSDAIIFPSLWEGHSIALLEILAIGCPVISSDIPAFREVWGNTPLTEDELFRPTEFGALFHVENIESCKAAIEYLYKNKDKLEGMRKYVNTIADKFTTRKQADVYVKAAEEVC